ncbi:MAG: hypothetical protein AB7U95_15790 [Reyranella sp.]
MMPQEIRATGNMGNQETAMNHRDELIRTKLLDRLTSVNVDTRMVTLEVNRGEVNVRGAVPSTEQRSRALEALAGAHSVELQVRDEPPSDSADGRGRSPVTGTSEESAHQSRHQTDQT